MDAPDPTPTGAYGPKCKACPVDADGTVCGGHGACVGDGTRGGSGKCKCSGGRAGKACSKCGKKFFSHVVDGELACVEKGKQEL